MSDQQHVVPEPPTTDNPSPSVQTVTPQRVRPVAILCKFVSIVITTLALAWMLHIVFAQNPIQVHWVLQVLLAIVAILSGAWPLIYQGRYWSLPSRRLQSLIPRVRTGELPIEALARVRGGMVDLVPVIQDVLRDLRQQRAAFAALDDEINHRVAKRTDALERKLGSLQQKASRDALTGLLNRRMLDEHLPNLIEQCRIKGIPLSLLMIDVDNFKLVNDTLGHAAGDDLLKNLGQLIRSTIRDEDYAFRCGGDEFIILLPGSTTREAESLAERLGSLVDSLGKMLKVPRRPRLSIGIATTTEIILNPTPENLMEAADQKLYLIKKARHKDRAVNPDGTRMQFAPETRQLASHR
jgi:diguanylate cyclase (GGDEF)-like protein